MENVTTLCPKTKLALFLPSLRTGGAEKVLLNLASGFIAFGLHVDMILIRAEDAQSYPASPDIHLIDLKARRSIASLPGLVQYLRKEKPQAVLSALDLPNLIAILARLVARVDTRVVVSAHNMSSYYKPQSVKEHLEGGLINWGYRHASHVIVPSKGLADDLSTNRHVPQDRIEVIYNPIITAELLLQSKAPVDHPFFKPGCPPVILAAGRLAEVKDFPTLLRAFARVHQTHPAHLVILGEGEQRPYLQHLADTLGIASDFDMPGFSANPFAYMHKASAFVLSSISEGLPNVLIEAMACGCPVISTDCPSGPTEILNGGKYGHLVPVGDTEVLANAIVRVLDGDIKRIDPEHLKRFSLENVTKRYLQVLGMTPRDENLS